MRFSLLLLAFVVTATCADAQRSLILTEPSVPTGESYVLLSTGEIVHGDVQAFPHNGTPARFVVDGREFDRRQVVEYGINGNAYALYHGIDARPLVLQRTSTGNANVYREVNYSTGATFFQVNNGPVQMATSQNLRAAFAGNDVAMRHLAREHRLNYAAYGAFATGAALVMAGTAVELGNVEGYNGVMIAASGVALAVSVNALVPMLQQRHRQNAIRAYNGR
jgi:hypothetical protein